MALTNKSDSPSVGRNIHPVFSGLPCQAPTRKIQNSMTMKRAATEESIPAKIPKTAEDEEPQEDFDVNRDVKCGISPSVYLREQSIMFHMASCLPPYTGIDVGYSCEDLPWESFVKSVLELNKINHKVDQKQLTVSLDLMKRQLTHGDIVNMSNYRLIHAYVVYRLKPTDTPLLLKTYMEYGYGAPCDFSDAPRGYFLGAYDIWYYYHLPDCLWPGSDIYDEAMKEIQERKNPDPSVSRRGHQSIEPSRFPSDYVLIYEEGFDRLIPSWFTLNLVEDDGLTSAGVARIRQRYQNRRQMLHSATSTITHGLFKNKIPQDLIIHMTAFIA